MSPAEIAEFGQKLVDAAGMVAKAKESQLVVNKLKAEADALRASLKAVKDDIAKAQIDLQRVNADKIQTAKAISDQVAAHKAAIVAQAAEIKAKADAAEKKAQAQIKDEKAELALLADSKAAILAAIEAARTEEAIVLDRIAKAKEAAKAAFGA